MQCRGCFVVAHAGFPHAASTLRMLLRHRCTLLLLLLLPLLLLLLLLLLLDVCMLPAVTAAAVMATCKSTQQFVCYLLL